MSVSNLSSNRTSLNINVKGSNFVVLKKIKTTDAATGIQIPETTERCIVFPFDRKKLKYMRDTYQKQSILGRCSADDIMKVITHIEEACNNFKRHRLYKTLIYLNVIIGVTVLIGSVAVIVAGLIKSNQGNTDIYTKSGQNMLTMIGILIFGFDVLVMYFGVIIVGCLSNDLSAVYLAEYDKVILDYKEKFEQFGMRWKIGTKRLWLELWLDEYMGPNGDDKSQNRKSSNELVISKNQQKLLDLRRASNEQNNLALKGKRGSFRNSMMLSRPESGAGSRIASPHMSQNTTPRGNGDNHGRNSFLVPSKRENHNLQLPHRPEDQL